MSTYCHLRKAIQSYIRLIYAALQFLRRLNTQKPLALKGHVFRSYLLLDQYESDPVFNKTAILPYHSLSPSQIELNSHPKEILDCLYLPSKTSTEIDLPTAPALLPISFLSCKPISATFKISWEKGYSFDLTYTTPSRFHYINVPEAGRSIGISNTSNTNMLVGKPIPLSSETHKPLVIHIMLDALPQVLVDKYSLEKLMPFTARYIASRRSIVYENCYAQSEWTLSSAASFFTGRYTTDHQIYHPRQQQLLAQPTIASTLKRHDYYSTLISNVPRILPYNRLDFGFDRRILAASRDASFLINEAMSQLKLKNTNQYICLAIFDLHEAHQLQPIDVQSQYSLETQIYETIKGNSKDPRPLVDPARESRLLPTIRHLDAQLNQIYTYLLQNNIQHQLYIHSDHGVNFLSNNTELLGKEREKVIFLQSSHDVGQATSDCTYTELRQLPSLVCENLSIQHRFPRAPHDICITESLYPGKPYLCAIRSPLHTLFVSVPWQSILNGNPRFNTRIVSSSDESQECSSNHPNAIQLNSLFKKHFEDRRSFFDTLATKKPANS